MSMFKVVPARKRKADDVEPAPEAPGQVNPWAAVAGAVEAPADGPGTPEEDYSPKPAVKLPARELIGASDDPEEMKHFPAKKPGVPTTQETAAETAADAEAALRSADWNPAPKPATSNPFIDAAAADFTPLEQDPTDGDRWHRGFTTDVIEAEITGPAEPALEDPQRIAPTYPAIGMDETILTAIPEGQPTDEDRLSLALTHGHSVHGHDEADRIIAAAKAGSASDLATVARWLAIIDTMLGLSHTPVPAEEIAAEIAGTAHVGETPLPALQPLPAEQPADPVPATHPEPPVAPVSTNGSEAPSDDLFRGPARPGRDRMVTAIATGLNGPADLAEWDDEEAKDVVRFADHMLDLGYTSKTELLDELKEIITSAALAATASDRSDAEGLLSALDLIEDFRGRN
ncbi:hypothetical protein [Agromyces humi]|uniref:hypothetical protein n=1 Tax=Agromyces humi TaxID=1766800 RepID=UPI001358DADE|nr:hypothetical protein [Agromyces humi]